MRRLRRVARRRRHALVASVAGILAVCVAAVAVRALLTGGDAGIRGGVDVDAPVPEAAAEPALAGMAADDAGIPEEDDVARSMGPDGAGPEEGGNGAAAPAPEAVEPRPISTEGIFPLQDAVPPGERVPKPAAVRGLYLNAWAAGSPKRRAQLIDLANRTEINAFVIDIKDASGYVSYRSVVPEVSRIGADRDIRIRDVRGMMAELREHGIYPIARIVVFQDPILAERRPDLAIQHVEGGIWRDHNGEVWVDPHNRQVWEYNIALAREALELGFSEIQWDYVRFPDVPRRYMATAVYPARENGETREQAIREFLRYSRDELAPLKAPVTADVFGLTTSAGDDMGIGQRWEMMVDVTDVLLPMVYPSHYAPGSYGIAHPNARPYETVKIALEHAIRRTRGVDGAATIRPWLQDFTLGWPPYGAVEVRAQIRAVYDVGLDEWVLWNPGSRYTAGALADASGKAPDLPLPDHGSPPDRRAPDVVTPEPAAARLLGRPVNQAQDTIPPDR